MASQEITEQNHKGEVNEVFSEFAAGLMWLENWAVEDNIGNNNERIG